MTDLHIKMVLLRVKVSRQGLRGEQSDCFSLDTTKHCHRYSAHVSSQPHLLTDHCPKEVIYPHLF